MAYTQDSTGKVIWTDRAEQPFHPVWQKMLDLSIAPNAERRSLAPFYADRAKACRDSGRDEMEYWRSLQTCRAIPLEVQAMFSTAEVEIVRNDKLTTAQASAMLDALPPEQKTPPHGPNAVVATSVRFDGTTNSQCAAHDCSIHDRDG